MSFSRRLVGLMGLWLGALLLAAVVPAGAQVTSGSIVGVVTDPTGGLVPHADVRVSDESHGLTQSATTDDSGFYRFSDLAPASYVLSVNAQGYGEARRTVTIVVDSTRRIDVQMAVTLSQSVEVTASVSQLQTTSGELGNVMTRGRIESLPLNRRDVLQLALLSAGVAGPVEDSELSSRAGFAMHVNGAREESNDFLLDGVDNNDPYVNRYVVQPMVDSVEEFKVATNSYSAEYGRNAGGQVNVVTRRGTNSFQGFGYEYFRNTSLDARNYFEEDGKQPYNRNQFGGGVGGPIVNGRTFFFGALDVLRERQTPSRQGSVPSVAERAGDLSAYAKVIDPFTGQPFANKQIPAARISPLAKQFLNLFPVPNRPGAPNYLGQPEQRDDQTQGTIRIDHRLSNADQLTFRYSDGKADLVDPYAEGTGVTAGYGELVNDRTWNVMAQYARTLGAVATNSLRFGGNGFSRDVLTQNHDVNVGASWGVDWLNVPAESQGYPIVDVAGFSRVGDPYTLPILRDTATYQVADDFSLSRGSHLVKIGGEYRHIALDSRLDLFSRGQLSFTGALSGSGIGDLLLGLPTLGLKAEADNPIRMRTSAVSTYLQDDWRLRPDLTVTLGVRYEYNVPPVDVNDNMSAYDPATGTLVPVGTNGVSRSGISPDRNNVAPRLGVSWTPTANTVIRGGYGVFYDSGMLTVNTSQYFNPPQFNLHVFFPTAQGLLTLSDPFPLSRGITPPATVSGLDPNLVSGYLQHWNLAVQRELPSVGTITVAYGGSKGSHLIRPRDINQPAPGPGDVQSRRPNPQYSDIFFVESEGRSRYESLQVSLDRPLSRSLSVLGAYTLSTSNDDASAFLGTPSDKNLPQDSHNPDAEWGPSSFDVRHRVSVAIIAQLPHTNVWTRDTQVQAIVAGRSGQAFTPLLRFDNSNTGNMGGSTSGSDRPNLVGDPELDHPTPDEWFNTSALAIPPAYTFGNAGRNSLRGPAYATVDVAMSRRIPSGTRALTVGVQAFNLFNRTNFNLPEHYVDEPSTFGRIFSAGPPRQIQLTARISF